VPGASPDRRSEVTGAGWNRESFGGARLELDERRSRAATNHMGRSSDRCAERDALGRAADG